MQRLTIRFENTPFVAYITFIETNMTHFILLLILPGERAISLEFSAKKLLQKLNLYIRE